MKTVRRLALATLALVMLLSTSARAQVMQQVPSEALIVIKVKNLKDVSDKIAALSQRWALNQFRPELNDPLGTLLTMANLGPGLNKTGDAAVAIFDPGEQAREPDVLVLLSITDFKAFAASLPNAAADGTFQLGNKKAYVGDWGKYAAVSPKQALTAKKGGGLQIPATTTKELDGRDVVAYANLKTIRKDLLPLFKQNKGKLMQDIEGGLKNAPNAPNEKYAPLIKSVVAQLMATVEEFLTDADAAILGANLSKDGISTVLMAEFDPNTYLGKVVKGVKNTDASFTAGLPEKNYFIFGGMSLDKQQNQVLNDILAPIEKELAALGQDGKGISDYVQAIKSLMNSVTGQNFGMVSPGVNAIQQQQGIIQMVSVLKGDAQKIAAGERELIAKQQELMKAFGPDAQMGAMTITPNARTVDGVSLDQLSSTMPAPQTPQQQQAAFIMQMLYGPKGMSGYAGAVGADKYVMVIGGGDELLNASIAAAKTNSDPVAKGPAAEVTKNLPSNRVGAFYLSVDQIAKTVFDFMAMQGMPAGVKLPPNLPPLGATIATEGTAIRVDGYIPAQTVESMIAAGMQLYLQQQGGKAPGQPGGL